MFKINSNNDNNPIISSYLNRHPLHQNLMNTADDELISASSANILASSHLLQIKNNSMTANLNYLILMNQFYNMSKWLNVIFATLISLFGVYGNLVSIMVFMNRTYRNVPLRTCFILISSSDLFVLLFHYLDFTLRSWVNLTGNYSTSLNFVDKCLICCKLIPYMRNVFRTISIYVLLLMTVQRNILLYFPLIRSIWINNKYLKFKLIVLVMISLIININNIYLNDLIENPHTGEMYCSVNLDYISLQFKIDIFFVTFTVLIPIVLVFILSFVLLNKIKSNAPNYYFNFCLCKRNVNDLIEEDNATNVPSQMNLNEMIDSNTQNNRINVNNSIRPSYSTHFFHLPNDNFKVNGLSGSLKRSFSHQIKRHQNSVKFQNTNYQIGKDTRVAYDAANNRVNLLGKSSSRQLNSFKRHINDKNHMKMDLPMNNTMLQKFNLTGQGHEDVPLNPKINQQNTKTSFRFKKKIGYSVRTTYMLVLLSKWFIILHLPYFICWILFHAQMNVQHKFMTSKVNAQTNVVPETTVISLPSAPTSASSYYMLNYNILNETSNNIMLITKHLNTLNQRLRPAHVNHTFRDGHAAHRSLQKASSSSSTDFIYDYYAGSSEMLENSEQHMRMNENEEESFMYSTKTKFLKGFLNIFEILFLFNYSINFLLYIINGSLFRRVYKKLSLRYLRRLKKFLLCRCCKD